MRALGWLARIGLIALCLALASEPGQTTAPQAVLRGDKALEQGQAAQAISEYLVALEVQPGDSTILARLVDSALNTRRPDLAAFYLRQQAALNGWTPSLNRKMADILIAQGNQQQAVAYWQASLVGTKADIPILRKLVDYTLKRREWDTTIAMLSHLRDIDPSDEQTLYQSGLMLAPTDTLTALDYLEHASADPQYRDAASAINATVAAHGKDASPALALQIGLTLMTLRVWPYAEHALTVAIDKGADNPAALAFLGVAQDQQGRDGWPVIDKAFIAAPADPLVNYAVALHWRLAGDAQKALAALVRAQALDPQNPAIAAETGLAYQMQGRLDDAALWLNVAVALAPNHAGFRTLLATFYADTHYDLTGQGLNAIRKLADLSPNDPDVRASLGWALFSTGQFDAARVELEKALLLDPTNTRARYYFGIFLENRGDIDGAISTYLYVYRAGPDNSFRDLAAGALKRLGYRLDPTTASQ